MNSLTTVATYKYVNPVFVHAALPMLAPGPDTIGTELLHNLYRACGTRRASESVEEAQYVAWLCNRLPVTMIDGAGNIHVDMRKGPQNRTLFTSHTDTMHYRGGANAIRLDESNPDAIKWRADEGHALGADDGAGIALMMHLITHGVAAYYIFFRDEEAGGVGSRWLADNMPGALDDIDRCISLDRAGYSDVVTHQARGRCCSDEFALALANALTSDDFTTVYLPDDTGVFTDSANLTDIVCECTNLSVGYKNQHGDGEWQDVTYLPILADQLVRVQWDDLPTRRKAGESDDVFAPSTDAFSTTSPFYDDETKEMVSALLAAHKGMHGDIIDIVASELVTAGDIAYGRRFVKATRITDEDYLMYAEALISGEMDTYAVLDALVEDLYQE